MSNTRGLGWRSVSGPLLTFALVFSLMVSTVAIVWADTVGTGGAVLSFGDGAVEVSVPPGAVAAEVDVTYSALTGDDIPGTAPAGTVFGSPVFTLAASPATTFTRAVNITVKYTDADIEAAGGIYTNVNIYAYDVAFQEWNLLASAIQDVPNKSFTTGQQTLGTYALVLTGVPPTPTPVPPTPTPAPAPKPAAPPETGGVAPGNGLLLGVLFMGAMLVIGGGYLLRRKPHGSDA